MRLGSRLVLLALVACGTRPAQPTTPAAAPTAVKPPPRAIDPERERRIAEYLAPGRGETAAQGSLPPGLDVPMDKESAALVKRCDGKRSDPESGRPLMAKDLKGFDPRCADLQAKRFAREIDTLRDVGAQQRIVSMAEAIAKAPPSCRAGAENPPHAKIASCSSMESFRWDVRGWSCIYERADERLRASMLDTSGSHWTFSIDPDLGTYEVVASVCYRADKQQEEWTELVIRGRLGDKPKPEHFFRRAAVLE